MTRHVVLSLLILSAVVAAFRLDPGSAASGDTDGDGCYDAQEQGASRTAGGERDPIFPWDFFDVPVPYLSAATPNSTGDGSIDLSDALAVNAYFGLNDNGPSIGGLDYDDDRDRNGVEDGRQYDRTMLAGSTWRTGPPNGAIDLSDTLNNLAQFGHACPQPGASVVSWEIEPGIEDGSLFDYGWHFDYGVPVHAARDYNLANDVGVPVR